MNARERVERGRCPWWLAGLVLLASCGGGGAGAIQSAAGTGPAAMPSTPYAAELRLCVDQTNQYRDSIGRKALTRSGTLDSYAAAAAKNDGTAHVSHQYFKQSNGGGVALAENEIPWWPLATLGSVRAVVEQGLQGFLAEGPKGGHYQNIAGPYTGIGCGLFVNGDEVTLTQDFR